jgi:hypothetical protein
LAGANGLREALFASLFSDMNRKLTTSDKTKMATLVAELLTRHATKLETFELSQEFSDMTNGPLFQTICGGIAQATALTTLDVSRCTIGDAGFAALIAVLPQQLQVLIVEVRNIFGKNINNFYYFQTI